MQGGRATRHCIGGRTEDVEASRTTGGISRPRECHCIRRQAGECGLSTQRINEGVLSMSLFTWGYRPV